MLTNGQTFPGVAVIPNSHLDVSMKFARCGQYSEHFRIWIYVTLLHLHRYLEETQASVPPDFP